MTSTVVISDAHFGINSSTLLDPKRVDRLFWEIWRYGNGCDEIVLLGDVFDLWRASLEKAVKDSKYFFERLFELDVKIVYVIGNHDHHLMVMNQDSWSLERIARGDFYPIYRANLSWNWEIFEQELEMYYPVYLSSFGGKRVLFTHGHHLNGIQSFTIQTVTKLRRLVGEDVSPADLERMMKYAYEGIHQSVLIEEIVDAESYLWGIPSMYEKIKSHICNTFRYTPVERHYDAINKFIKDRNYGNVDCFVYGDTHKPDIFKRDGGPLAVNSGSWIDEGFMLANCEEISDTYLIINEDGITLRRLGQKAPMGYTV
jgi:predicted phosphodiesterase